MVTLDDVKVCWLYAHDVRNYKSVLFSVQIDDHLCCILTTKKVRALRFTKG